MISGIIGQQHLNSMVGKRRYNVAGLSELHQSKRGVAAAIACLVQTLNETDPTFQQRFLNRLGAAYKDIRDEPTGTPPSTSKNDHDALEPLSWIREMLTGWNMIHGQREPFLSYYQPKD